MNMCLFLGEIVKPVEVSQTKSGAPLCNLFVAVPDTIRVTAFDHTYSVASKLQVGDFVRIEARVTQPIGHAYPRFTAFDIKVLDQTAVSRRA